MIKSGNKLTTGVKFKVNTKNVRQRKLFLLYPQVNDIQLPKFRLLIYMKVRLKSFSSVIVFDKFLQNSAP